MFLLLYEWLDDVVAREFWLASEGRCLRAVEFGRGLGASLGLVSRLARGAPELELLSSSSLGLFGAVLAAGVLALPAAGAFTAADLGARTTALGLGFAAGVGALGFSLTFSASFSIALSSGFSAGFGCA